MNVVCITGNLSKDPELRTTASGLSTCSFTVAVNRRVRNADGSRTADFIPVVAWRQLADLCGQYLAKGRKVNVVGSIQTRSYDAQDGSKRYVTEIVADTVDFLSSSDGAHSNAPAGAPEVSHDTARQRNNAQPHPGVMSPAEDDDDLPF